MQRKMVGSAVTASLILAPATSALTGVSRAGGGDPVPVAAAQGPVPVAAAQGRIPVTAAHRGSGAHVPCARLEPCSGRMASRTGVRRGEQRRSKNKTMKGCHAEPPCETLAVQDIEKATNSWQIDQSTWLVHAARRFGNRANSGESPSFASPPRDGFAIVDRFAPVFSCLESSVGLLCRPA